MNLQEIRQKYPQYNDLSDEKLAQGLHKKYYSDMDFGEFSKKIGFDNEIKPVKVINKTPTFSDKPDFDGLPVGEPSMGAKALNLPFVPLQEILRSPGAVDEATLSSNPEQLELKGKSILDFAGDASKGLLGRGASSDALPFDITNKEDFTKIAEKFGRIGTELAAMGPYSTGLLKLMGGAGETMTLLQRASYEKDISKAIEKGMEKGIKPSVSGKKTFGQYKMYLDKAKDAVRTIVDNKSSLRLTDEVGRVVDTLPKNLKQFSQAVEQTKRNIFKQYDALTQSAGKVGATVDLSPIVAELEKVATNKTVVDINPDIANYAQGLAERLKLRKQYGLNDAQDAIATLNSSLESFYKNPTYENANRAYVDSLLANNLRKSLDKTIESTTGKQYQVLKNKYGSLKSIEKDVTHRAIVDARKNLKGLIDFTDVFSGYHAIRGMLELNPATVGAATSSKGIAALWKWANNPNRYIKNMFSDVEKLMSKRKIPVTETITSPVRKQIGWDGVYTRSQTGEPINLYPGQNQPIFNMPNVKQNPVGLLELKRYYEKSNGPISDLMLPESSMSKSILPKKLVTKKQPTKITRKKFEIPERIKKAIAEAKRKEALDKINKFRSSKGLKSY